VCCCLCSYLPLVDEANLYDTSYKSFHVAVYTRDNGKLLSDPDMITRFRNKAHLVDEATAADALWQDPSMVREMLLPLPQISGHLAALFAATSQ
jgi:hypothetical protein